MSKPTLQELKQTIKELSDYRDRLKNEVLMVSKQLRLPQKKIDSTLQNHMELQRVNKVLKRLMEQEENTC